MQQDIINIDLKIPTGWEDLDNSLSLGKKKTRFSFCSRLLTNLTQKQLQLRYLFTLIAQGYSINEVKAFCLFRWNKITILHRIDDMKARNSCMDTMRELFRQFMSKLILEKTKLEQHCIYIDPRISFNEIDRYFFSGCACAYSQIAVDVYTDLRINPDEWNE